MPVIYTAISMPQSFHSSTKRLPRNLARHHCLARRILYERKIIWIVPSLAEIFVTIIDNCFTRLIGGDVTRCSIRVANSQHRRSLAIDDLVLNLFKPTKTLRFDSFEVEHNSKNESTKKTYLQYLMSISIGEYILVIDIVISEIVLL